MFGDKSTKMKSAVGDFALIVVGVLAALLAESWWSEREDREAENQILVDAVAEFRENVEILDSDIAYNDVIYDLLLKFVDMPDSALQELTDGELSELFALENVSSAGFDPAMGAIDALVRSGDLKFIKDRQLRLHLVRWSALVTKAERINLQHGQFFSGGLLRLLPAFEADRKWTILERREAFYWLQIYKGSLTLVLDSMKELRATAREIFERLAELTE